MSARLDAELAVPASQSLAPPNAFAVPIPAASEDPDDRWGGHALPSDHPVWMKDTLSLSQRARGLLAKLPPVVVTIVSAWEHRVRAILVGGRTLQVDASGSYRFD